jgi:hypothetical protein
MMAARAPLPTRTRWRAPIRWGSPKVAYAVAAMAIAAAGLSFYRSVDRESNSGSAFQTQSVHLLAQTDLQFRSQAQDSGTPILQVSADTEVVTANVWLPASMRPTSSDAVEITISDERGPISTRPIVAKVVLVDEQPTVTVALRRAELRPGLLTLRIEPLQGDASSATVWCQLGLRFEAGTPSERD